VTSDGLLLFPSEGGGAFARSCLIQGPACSSHGGNESLLFPSESRGRDVLLLPLGGGGGSRDGGLLLVDREVGAAARHDRQDGGG
jgi:hypothetical protein